MRQTITAIVDTTIRVATDEVTTALERLNVSVVVVEVSEPTASPPSAGILDS